MAKTKKQNGRDARVERLVTDCLADATEESLQLVRKKMRYSEGSKRYFLTKQQVHQAIAAFIKHSGNGARGFARDLREYGYLSKRKPLIPLFCERSFHALELITEILESKQIKFKTDDLIAMLKAEDDGVKNSMLDYALSLMVKNISDDLTIRDIERICNINTVDSYQVIETIFALYGEKFSMKRTDVSNVAPNVNSTIYSVPLGLDSQEEDLGSTYMVGYLNANDSVTLVAVYSGHLALTGMDADTLLKIQAAGNPLSRDAIVKTLKSGFKKATEVGALALS